MFRVLRAWIVSPAALALASSGRSTGPAGTQGVGAQACDGHRIALDTTGAARVTGIILGPVDFGGGPLPVMGGEDIFLAELGP